jgi:IS605 OrfB family transposase
MHITLTSKVRILPDEETKDLLIRTMHAYTSACNYVSVHVFATQTTNKKLLHDELYRDIRSHFALRSQMAESVIRTVVARYKTLTASHEPWKILRFSTPQYDLVWNRDYSLKGDIFSVNTLEGRRKMPFCRPGSSLDGKLGTARLVLKHGKFYLHISVTHEVTDVTDSAVTNVVGIDRGIRFLATAYDSAGKTAFFSGASVKGKRAHFAALRKELQKVGTPSSRRRLKAIGQRENRWMRDLDHCISKALAEMYPEGTLFVLEDLKGIRKATERIRVSDRYVSVSWPYYDLEQKLIYKAAMHGHKVIKVDPAYTSQTCPHCGRRDSASRDKRRHLFRCTGCGYTSNDDRIAAMNLYSMGNEYLVQSGVSMPLSGGVQSITPDVRRDPLGGALTSPDVTPADTEYSESVTNAGGISRPLQGSHKPLLQGVSLSRGS